MKRILKIVILSILGLIGLLLIILIIAFFSLSGDFNPPDTVVTNKSLPQIKLNNIKIHCETFGSDTNDVIVVLHGGPGLDYKNLLVLNELSNKYYVVFFDQRGSGLSERVSEDKLQFKFFIDDLNAIINKFSKDKKVNIIAHSWGGILATAYLTKHKEKVNKLILAEPGSLTTAMDQELQKNNGTAELVPSFKLLIHLIKCWLMSNHVDGPDDYASEDFFINSFIMNMPADNHPLSEYYCNGKLSGEFKNNWRFGALASKWTPDNKNTKKNNYRSWEKDLKNIDNNVLFLCGECDKVLGEKFQRKQMKLFKNSSLISIPNSGHLMIAENPTASIKAISKFLNNQD